MTKEEILNKLIKLGCYLCPEPGGHWSVVSIDGENGEPFFQGWGKTPETAIQRAIEAYVNWGASE